MKRRSFSYYKSQSQANKANNLSKVHSYCDVCDSIIPRSRLNWHKKTKQHQLNIPIYEFKSLDYTLCQIDEALKLLQEKSDEFEQGVIEARITKIEDIKKSVISDLEKLEKNRSLN